MVKRVDHLFDGIANFAALVAAARRAVRGKRAKPGAARFMAQLEPACLRLERELLAGSYRPGTYREIVVHDPKRRLVSAAPFRDRVVHHALVQVVGPVFERGFVFDSYANRTGKGTHRAVARYEHFRDRHAHVLRADIWRFFPAIDHAVLLQALARRIACRRTLALCRCIVDASNAQEPVELYFPGDDLFTPYERRRGLPLGNLTSQFFANVYLDALDHWVTEVLRAPYLRYVDDFALFDDDPARLADWQARLAEWLQGRRLRLHPAKTRVQPCAEPAVFLGCELHAGGLRRLPGANVARFRARLQRLRADWAAGTADRGEVQARVGAWVAHARHAHTAGLRHALLRGGWFDPFLADGRPLSQAASASCNAACPSRRRLEQQPAEGARGQPQQEHARQPERQHRLPSRQHGPGPEPGPATAAGTGVCRGAVQGRRGKGRTPPPPWLPDPGVAAGAGCLHPIRVPRRLHGRSRASRKPMPP